MLKALTLLFVYLKLTNQINWNWFYVLSPLIVNFFILLILETFKSLMKDKREIPSSKDVRNLLKIIKIKKILN